MNFSSVPVEHRIALYDHFKNRRRASQEEAYSVLGGKCSVCGSTDDLRHRFVDANNPLKSLYRTNPPTLYRRICFEPHLRAELHLLCRVCRLARANARVAMPSPVPDNMDVKGRGNF